jgi:uncharacterized glyoxalase superfamily protein PhnB
MADTQARPPGMPWISANLTVKDAAAALDFYQRAFGFTRWNGIKDESGKVIHADMTWHDAVVVFAPEGASGMTEKAPATLGIESPTGLCVYCDDVDALFERATAAGAKVEMPPKDMFWGDRFCRLIDPDGNAWGFATHIGHPAA